MFIGDLPVLRWDQLKKSAYNRIEPLAFLTTTIGAAHCEYVTGVMTFISSRRFSSLSTRGSVVYSTGRLGRKMGFVEGLSASVASA